jgi:hypothetical protein
MRFWLSLFLLAPALFAQAPAGQPNYWHFQAPPGRNFFPGTPVAPVKAAPKVCSVPLVNVLKDRPGVKYRMRKIPVAPSAGEQFTIETVTPPAPPCDDEKR